MSAVSTSLTPARAEASPDRAARVACLVTAVLTVPVFALTDLGTGETGASVTDVLVEDRATLISASLMAVLVAAGLMLATVRLARSVAGDAGRVMVVAGGGVALMYAVYHGVFGAGAVVASQMLADPGPGLGEASFLLLNMAEIARFAPGLALVAAAVVARRQLPRGLWVAAAALLVLVFVPLTTWVAALLTPAWLAMAGAWTGRSRAVHGAGV
jgi:hypothetical protein